MVPLAVFTVLLALTSAIPIETEVSDVQISNRPIVLDADEIAAQVADGEQTVLETIVAADPEEDASEIQIINRPIVIAADELAEQDSDASQSALEVHYVGDAEDAESASEEETSNNVEIQAVHLPSLNFEIAAEEEESADEPVQVQAVHLPSLNFDIAASEDENSEDVAQVQAVHLPSLNFEVAATEEESADDNVVHVAVHLPSLNFDLGEETHVAEEEETAGESAGQVEIAHHLPITIAVDQSSDAAHVINLGQDESPCASCFAYMTNLIDQLTNSIAVPQTLPLALTKEVKDALGEVQYPNTREVVYEDAVVHELASEDDSAANIQYLRPALLTNLLRGL